MRARLGDALWVAGTPIRLALVGLIRLYRVTLGRLVGGRCRFYPSCSEYAESAIGGSGVSRGLVLSAWRLLRCSPLSRGGVDHPPMGRGSVRVGTEPPEEPAVYDATIHRGEAAAPAGRTAR